MLAGLRKSHKCRTTLNTVTHGQAGAAGVGVGGMPSRLQQLGPMQLTATARPQRWVLEQEEQQQLLMLASNVAKLGTGHVTVPVSPMTTLSSVHDLLRCMLVQCADLLQTWQRPGLC